MNKYFILLLLMCSFHLVMAQTEEKNDAVLQGRIYDIVTIRLFPLINDSILCKRSNYPILYPLLIVNDVPIRDEKRINCFRNYFDRTQIKKLRRISKTEAEQKGIRHVPKDGVLFITVKRGYYFDFSCE